MVATLLAVGDVARASPLPVLLGTAVVALAFGRRRGSSAARWLAALTLLVAAAARVHTGFEQGHGAELAAERTRATLQGIEALKDGLVADVEGLALQAAALPETRRALAGEKPALSALFSALEKVTRGRREALAVHTPGRATIAWAGAVGDPPGLQGLVRPGRDVFVVEGSVSTSLVATAPVSGPDGTVLGLATAEVPLRAHRNIRNEFLNDFDRLADQFPGVDVDYVDIRSGDAGDAGEGIERAAGSSASTREAALTTSTGTLLATVRIRPPSTEESLARLRGSYRRAVSLLAVLVCLVWTASAVRTKPLIGLALGSTTLRGILLLLGPPWPGPGSPLLSADHYAAAWLGPLLRSPLDFLLTTTWLAILAALVAVVCCRHAPPASRIAWRVVATAGALPLLTGVFVWISDTVTNSPLDLEALSLVPRSSAHLVLQVGLLLILAGGLLLLVALFLGAGPLPTRTASRVALLASWTLLGVLAFQLWPRHLIGLPLLPAILLFLFGAGLGGTCDRWLPRVRSAPPGGRAGLALAAVAILTTLLHPSLVHFGEKNTRLQIEHGHKPDVLRQPEWRGYVLEETRRRIDGLDLLEEDPPGPNPPGVEQLAFFVWAQTGLATFGFSSAVEIQDPSGAVVSRFALNLPSLEAAPRRLPAGLDWEVTPERLPVGSAEERVVHARRLLVYHGVPHGAVHVYLGQDFWNLPFVTGRDPYSILYRSAPRAAFHERPIGLVVYERNRGLVFGSAEHPPAVAPPLLAQVRGARTGLWTTLTADGRPQHTYLFSDGETVYGLSYPRLGAGRFAADLVEAVSAMCLVALTVLFSLMLLRTLWGRPTLSLPSLYRTIVERFTLRLFVAFVALAIVPVAVLQVVVRGFVRSRLWVESDEQALDRAAVARRAVETYSSFQRGEGAGNQAISDDALVFVAGLVRNDVAVFERGRLRASSKRELYASGLLPPRVSAPVYRALVLDGEPAVLSTDTIGGFSYRVASVPVELGGPAPAVLSLPLGLRQRDVEAILEDLDRTIRLGSVLFLVVAALLAHSMARRISGPIQALTRATQRVAEGDLTTRVEATSRDELQALVLSFNQMAGDLERQRQDLERSNRLAAWAEMARQVAHEVKNPLTPIQLSAEHLRRVFTDPKVDFQATLASCTETILKQVRTLRGIVTEFSAFARPPASILERCDLEEIVTEVLRPYQASLPPGVSLSRRTESAGNGGVAILGDRRLLERAVVNLLENALQAVGDAGEIEIGVGRVEDRAQVTVTDSGPGIDPAVRGRLFEPFFSTKAAGSGLGLALVKKIAEDHGGGVSLDSEPANPTRMMLWLPVAPTDQNSL